MSCQPVTHRQKRSGVNGMVLAVLAGALSNASLAAQSAPATAQAAQPSTSASSAKLSATSAPPTAVHAAVTRSRYHPNPVSKRAGEYYPLIWGIDSLRVKAVESGELIRFSYRIVDPSKATVFNDKKIDAFLDFPVAHARLVVPSLEKVGQLRQYNSPEAGKSYWMAFSNPRLTVRRGDHVNVVIGKFHADGLIVE